jgi:hypothetical protein
MQFLPLYLSMLFGHASNEGNAEITLATANLAFLQLGKTH